MLVIFATMVQTAKLSYLLNSFASYSWIGYPRLSPPWTILYNIKPLIPYSISLRPSFAAGRVSSPASSTSAATTTSASLKRPGPARMLPRPPSKEMGLPAARPGGKWVCVTVSKLGSFVVRLISRLVSKMFLSGAGLLAAE